jgi:hypothetical protein
MHEEAPVNCHQRLPAARLKTAAYSGICLLASFSGVFAQFFQEPQQGQPFVF